MIFFRFLDYHAILAAVILSNRFGAILAVEMAKVRLSGFAIDAGAVQSID
jgi:hypothetical protein